METPVLQWLLIGGPRHGEVVWVKGGHSLIFEHDGQRLSYQGSDFLSSGRMYRIGVLDFSAVKNDEVSRLIQKTKLQHIAGS